MTKYISFSGCGKNSNHKVLKRVLVDYLVLVLYLNLDNYLQDFTSCK